MARKFAEGTTVGAGTTKGQIEDLLIKAKLIAVNEGITTFEAEFLSHACLASGNTVGEQVIPEMKQAALDGRMPKALTMPGVNA